MVFTQLTTSALSNKPPFCWTYNIYRCLMKVRGAVLAPHCPWSPGQAPCADVVWPVCASVWQCFTGLGDYTVTHGSFHPDRNFGHITMDATSGAISTETIKARGVLCNYRGMCSW